MVFPRIYEILPNDKKAQIIFLFMVITSLAEIISIASLVPFLAVITAPEKLYNFELLSPVYSYFNIGSKNDLLLPVTMIFIGAAIFSGSCRILLLHISTRLTGGITSYLSSQIYKIYLNKEYLYDFITSLPQKYDTVIGSGGRVMSGGQIQRLGIARALYKNAELIVLDESTNALDINTETRLFKDLSKLPKKITILIIAHSESSFAVCNKRININHGGLDIYNA